MPEATVSLCFVCLGNICRSPTAEGVMTKLIADAGLSSKIAIDSAGTGAYHAGERADARRRAEALSRGVELTSIARQFVASDFDRFDYVVAMDRRILRDLTALARSTDDKKKLHLLREFDPESHDDLDVPDPYYDGEHGFALVYDICVAGCQGLLAQIRREYRL